MAPAKMYGRLLNRSVLRAAGLAAKAGRAAIRRSQGRCPSDSALSSESRRPDAELVPQPAKSSPPHKFDDSQRVLDPHIQHSTLRDLQ
jgi:hypothetical protein